VCVIGSDAFLAKEAIDSEPGSAVGEWTSDIMRASNNGSFTVCLILDLKFTEFAKRVDVELIYEDVNSTIQKATVFEYNVEMHDTDRLLFSEENYAMFELYLNNVLSYQVCISYCDISLLSYCN